MVFRDRLTNESIRGIFKNNFDLANYAMRLGRHYIKAGHEISVDEILDQIRKNPKEQFLKDLEASEKADDEEETE